MIRMTQDQAVPEDETAGARTEESSPVTRFQKVASALRGGASERDEQNQAAADPAAEPAQKRDYRDDRDAAAGHEDEAVAVTSPDTPPDDQATEPDMFGTTKRTAAEPAASPAPEDQPGAATIVDVPVAH